MHRNLRVTALRTLLLLLATLVVMPAAHAWDDYHWQRHHWHGYHHHHHWPLYGSPYGGYRGGYGGYGGGYGGYGGYPIMPMGGYGMYGRPYGHW